MREPQSSSQSPAHPPELDPHGRTIYRCGSLTYTKGGLVLLFAWLLWGDFCFTMMEAVVPSILPLKLRSLDSSNTTIALIMTTLPAIFNTTVAPWVSFQSDRYRSKWGRRIPFILYTIPFLVGAMLVIGFSDHLGGWLHAWFLKGSGITRNMTIIGLLALFAGMFELFNMFVSSVYYYLFNDVVPTRFLSSFMSWFRLVGVLSAAGYNAFVFKYAMSHMQAIYLSAGLLYLIGFGAVCFMVKEGEYPPPADAGDKPSLAKDIRAFSSNCFTSRYYWDIFLYYAFSAASQSCAVFGVFSSQSFGLDLGQIGKLGAIGGCTMAACLLFAGPLVDRLNPVRIDAYLVAYNVIFAVTGLAGIFFQAPDPRVFFWVSAVTGLFGAAMAALRGAAELPRLMILFPKDRFGQFCGAMTLVRYAGFLLFGALAGLYMDGVKRFFPPGDLFPYRLIAIWPVVFISVAFVFYYRAYRCWKRLGGDGGYTPPTTPFRYADLPKARGAGVVREALVAPLVGVAGAFGGGVFWIVYFRYYSYNLHNIILFGIASGVTVFLLFVYLWLIRFMERP